MAEIAPERYEGVEKTSFGFKLLEKQGWSEGQGLGREKQGIKKHITAKKKFDNLGVGTNEADKRNQDWTLQMVGFTTVLKGLSEITSRHSNRRTESSESEGGSYASDASIPFTLGKRKGDEAEDADSRSPAKKGKKGRKGGESAAVAVSLAHGELQKGKKGKKKKGGVRFEAEVEAAPVEKRKVSHLGRFQKREKAKCVRSYSSTDLAAILGEKEDPFAAFASTTTAAAAAAEQLPARSSSGSDSDQSDSGNAQEVVAEEAAANDPNAPKPEDATAW